MFGSVILLAFAAGAGQISIPLGKPPRQVEQARAPIQSSGPIFARACKDWDDWDKPAPPVGIFGNTYLVGTCGISAILITDPAGDILIDGGTEKDADLIAANELDTSDYVDSLYNEDGTMKPVVQTDAGVSVPPPR